MDVATKTKAAATDLLRGLRNNLMLAETSLDKEEKAFENAKTKLESTDRNDATLLD